MRSPKTKLARPLEVLKASSNPIRYRILLALREIGPATWTHIAHLALGQEPWPVSGKLAYHMRVLREAGLIAQGPDGRYELTAIGQAVLDFIAWLGSWEPSRPVPIITATDGGGYGPLTAREAEAQGEN